MRGNVLGHLKIDSNRVNCCYITLVAETQFLSYITIVVTLIHDK